MKQAKNLINLFLIHSSAVIWLVPSMTLKSFLRNSHPLCRKFHCTGAHPWPLLLQASLVPWPFDALVHDLHSLASFLVSPSGCLGLGHHLFSVYSSTFSKWLDLLWFQLIDGWFLSLSLAGTFLWASGSLIQLSIDLIPSDILRYLQLNMLKLTVSSSPPNLPLLLHVWSQWSSNHPRVNPLTIFSSPQLNTLSNHIIIIYLLKIPLI